MLSGDDILDNPGETANLRDKFALLICRYAELSVGIEREEHRTSIEQRSQFSELIGRFIAAHACDRRQQEDTADDFNILEVLQLTHNEVRHSMILAWLLDHDMDRHGTHAQGALGFRLFLQELGLPEKYGSFDYWVNRELQGEDSTVDIEIAARGKFLIHIENKIWADEGVDQTCREWSDLKQRAAELGVNTDPTHPRVFAYFLTPMGTKPKSNNFRPISWHRVVNILTAFAEQAKPANVKLFAAHYAKLSNVLLSRSDRKRKTSMPKQLLNEAEVLLLNQWKDAYLLERSMERVREKYNGLFSKVLEEVRRSHPVLDASVNHMTQRGGQGEIGLTRKCWPGSESFDPPGLWMANIRLDLLVDESEYPPAAVI